MALIQSLSTEAIIALINAGTWPQQFAIVSGNLTTSGTALAVDVSKCSNIAIHVKNTGVAADIAGVFAFEASIDSTNGVDGTWVPIQAARSNDNTLETGRAAASLAGGAASAYAWEASVAGFRWFRIRCSTSVTATAIETWSISRSTYGTGVVGLMGTIPVSGTIAVSGAPAAGGALPVSIAGTVLVDEANSLKIAPSADALAYQAVTAVSNNAAVIKNTSGQLLEIVFVNTGAATMYLKLYNKTTTPAPASDSALLMDIITVAAAGRVAIEYGTLGKKFPAGIGIAVVSAAAFTDNSNAVVGGLISASYI